MYNVQADLQLVANHVAKLSRNVLDFAPQLSYDVVAELVYGITKNDDVYAGIAMAQLYMDGAYSTSRGGVPRDTMKCVERLSRLCSTLVDCMPSELDTHKAIERCMSPSQKVDMQRALFNVSAEFDGCEDHTRAMYKAMCKLSQIPEYDRHYRMVYDMLDAYGISKTVTYFAATFSL